MTRRSHNQRATNQRQPVEEVNMAIDSLGHSSALMQIQFTPADIENLLHVLKLGFKATDDSEPNAYHEGFYNAVKSLLATTLKGLQECNQPALFKKVLHAIKIIESIPIIIMIQNDSPLVPAFSTAANKLRGLDESIDMALKNIEKAKHKNDVKGG